MTSLLTLFDLIIGEINLVCSGILVHWNKTAVLSDQLLCPELAARASQSWPKIHSLNTCICGIKFWWLDQKGLFSHFSFGEIILLDVLVYHAVYI